MGELVSASEIEQIVGAARHATEHIGRAVSNEQTVYILHSHKCKESGIDLRDCPFSLALDNGIDGDVWPRWADQQDKPVPLAINHGYLVPNVVAADG